MTYRNSITRTLREIHNLHEALDGVSQRAMLAETADADAEEPSEEQKKKEQQEIEDAAAEIMQDEEGVPAEEPDEDHCEPPPEAQKLIAPLASIAGSVIVGDEMAKAISTEKEAKKKDPKVEEFRRLSGTWIDESTNFSLRQLKETCLLATIAEMVQLDLGDFMVLDEEEHERVGKHVAPILSDPDQVTQAARLAKQNGANRAVMGVVGNADAREQAQDILRKIVSASKLWMRNPGKGKSALRAESNTQPHPIKSRIAALRDLHFGN